MNEPLECNQDPEWTIFVFPSLELDLQGGDNMCNIELVCVFCFIKVLIQT